MSNKQPFIKITFFIILQLCLSLTCYAQYESDYVREIVKHLGGEREVSVTSGRVDILNETHTIEVEFANKWKNSIGQSLWYSQQTEKMPGIVLILKSKYDYKYYIQLNSTLATFGLT